MNMVTASMASKWSGLVFVDLMAGPGICIDRSDGSEFIGSPLRALQTRQPWTRALFIESDDALRDALEQRVAKAPRANSATVIPGDSNSSAVIQRIRDVTDGSLSLAFVDLLGQEIAFDTIRALSINRSIDLWFSFPEYDLRRNATIAPRGGDEADRWTRFFGTDAWQTITRSRRPAQALVGLRRLYQEQLATLGYLTAVSRLPMTNSRGKSMYRPILAAKHPRGLDFFGKALLDRPASEPARLFDLLG